MVARCPAYVAAQVLGAVVGAFTIVGVLGTAASDIGLGVASYGDAIPWYQAFFAEFIGTFLLVFAVFGVIYRKAAPGWAGLAIGMVVFAAIIPVAPTTGASINPARTTGPMLVQQILGGTSQWEQWPVYVDRRARRRCRRGRRCSVSSPTPPADHDDRSRTDPLAAGSCRRSDA